MSLLQLLNNLAKLVNEIEIGESLRFLFLVVCLYSLPRVTIYGESEYA